MSEIIPKPKGKIKTWQLGVLAATVAGGSYFVYTKFLKKKAVAAAAGSQPYQTGELATYYPSDSGVAGSPTFPSEIPIYGPTVDTAPTVPVTYGGVGLGGGGALGLGGGGVTTTPAPTVPPKPTAKTYPSPAPGWAPYTEADVASRLSTGAPLFSPEYLAQQPLIVGAATTLKGEEVIATPQAQRVTYPAAAQYGLQPTTKLPFGVQPQAPTYHFPTIQEVIAGIRLPWGLGGALPPLSEIGGR